MEYLIGVGLAAAVCAFALLAGFDRDRVFYPNGVAVIATVYILFAVGEMGLGDVRGGPVCL